VLYAPRDSDGSLAAADGIKMKGHKSSTHFGARKIKSLKLSAYVANIG